MNRRSDIAAAFGDSQVSRFFELFREEPDATELQRADDLELLESAGLSHDSAALGPRPEDLPEKIGEYRICGQLGTGGMGRVLLAIQAEPRRLVALKILREMSGSAAAIERMAQEARLLARIDHPGVATVHELGRLDASPDSAPFLVMQFVPGVTLGDWLSQTSSRQDDARLAKILEYGEAIARALAEVHRVGIVHRDVKPTNVILTPSGQVVLIDFGIAVDPDRSQGLTEPDRAVGTAAYMSPEHLRGARDLDGRSDVWSLGVLIFEACCGQRPFHADSEAELMLKISSPDIEPDWSRLPTLSRDLVAVLRRALEKDRRERYASAAQLADELGRLRAGHPVEARHLGPLTRVWRRARRHPRVAALVVLAVSASLWGTWSRQQRKSAVDDLSADIGTFQTVRAKLERGETPADSEWSHVFERLSERAGDERARTFLRALADAPTDGKLAEEYLETLRLQYRDSGDSDLRIVKLGAAVREATRTFSLEGPEPRIGSHTYRARLLRVTPDASEIARADLRHSAGTGTRVTWSLPPDVRLEEGALYRLWVNEVSGPREATRDFEVVSKERIESRLAGFDPSTSNGRLARAAAYLTLRLAADAEAELDAISESLEAEQRARYKHLQKVCRVLLE
ncbi:MAG: serine/threonine-protein kinase [Planctomycetota bacterium]